MAITQGQTGSVTMAPLFAQPDRQMVTGFPLAITHRKEEINSKNKHALSLPICGSLFSKAKYLFLHTDPEQLELAVPILCVCLT